MENGHIIIAVNDKETHPSELERIEEENRGRGRSRSRNRRSNSRSRSTSVSN